MSTSNRLTIVAASLVLLVSCSVIGSYFYLKQKAQSMPVVDRLAAPDPKIVAKTEADKEARVLKFRTQFETWAKAHQSDIRAMMLAQPNDLAALHKVSLALPSIPSRKRDGVDGDDFVDLNDDSNPKNFWCSWSHMAVGAKAARPELIEEAKKGEESVFRQEQVAFNITRDFVVIWVASSRSQKQYALWVSGRVTYSHIQLPMVDPKRVTIIGPYEFLKGIT